MAREIEPPKKGDQINELWRVVEALTKRVNALSNMSIAPLSAGKVTHGDGNTVIELNTVKCEQ